MAKATRKTGSKYNAKVITLDGVSFRSRLEAQCYTLLKDAGVTFLYEAAPVKLADGVKYHGVEYRSRKASEWSRVTRKDVDVRYRPDFRCPDWTWVIETKGFRTQSFAIKWRMFKTWCARTFPDRPPLLITASTKAAVQRAVREVDALRRPAQN